MVKVGWNLLLLVLVVLCRFMCSVMLNGNELIKFISNWDLVVGELGLNEWLGLMVFGF